MTGVATGKVAAPVIWSLVDVVSQVDRESRQAYISPNCL